MVFREEFFSWIELFKQPMVVYDVLFYIYSKTCAYNSSKNYAAYFT